MTNVDHAYQFIRSRIILGIYEPGHILSENQLSIRLNMSRTPIREAIKKLENDGLIEQNGQETKVTEISLEELKENYDLRSMLESYALKKNFAHLDKKELAKFSQKFDQVLKQPNWQEYLELDSRFHYFLTNNGKQTTLQKSLDVLAAQTNRMRFAIRDDQHCMKSSIKEIKQIIAAIQANNLVMAINKLDEHIKNVYLWEESFLKSKNK